MWQDREVRFDCLSTALQCRKGEVVIDSINSVEDTKGNNGERGACVIQQAVAVGCICSA